MTAKARLFEPLNLSGLVLRNRVVMAPMTRARSGQERIPNAIMAEYYAQRASAGLIITEATTISEQANGWNESPGIYTDAMTDGWRQIVDTVHGLGGTIFLQLWHTGRASHSSFHEGRPAVAPSPIKMNAEYVHTPKGKEPPEIPRPLETEEIPSLIEDYCRATERAIAAGFDGVEIHSANGYLLDTFMQSKTNQRTDRYGGSIENRYRLLDEIVEATIAVWSPSRIGVKLSPNGSFNDMGSPDYREQFTFAASQLDRFDLAYLHVVDGLDFGNHGLGEPMTLEDFRKVFRGKLIGNAGYTQETAEKAIAEGRADAIAFGRPFITNPDLVERFANSWPLNSEVDVSTWYSPMGSRGYTDFPKASDR